MRKLSSLTIGIPAYNEAKNITKLISSILTQKCVGFEIRSILVSSDGSTDETVAVARLIKDHRVRVIANQKREGIARGLNQIINATHTDILVTLDADIQITDTHFIQKMVDPILANSADLTSSAIRELHPHSFVAKSLSISMKLKEVVFMEYHSGDNVYTCHGLSRAYSRQLFRKLHFPVSVGNDMYSYFACKSLGMKYLYVPSAVAWYRLPETFSDHLKQSLRFFVSGNEQESFFSQEKVRNELQIPVTVYVSAARAIATVIMSDPLHAISYMCIQLYIRFRSFWFVPKDIWEIAVTSKNL